MLKIRFSKVGRKHEPAYRLVLTEHTNAARTGKYLEILGSYDSRRAEKAEVNADRIKHWLSHGVQLSDTAHNLLLKMGVIEGKRRNVLSKTVMDNAKKKAEAPAPEAVPAEEPAVEAEPAPVSETPEAQSTEEVEVEKVENATIEESAPAPSEAEKINQ